MFFNKCEIIKMLKDYHNGNNKDICSLGEKIKYFTHRHDYHKLNIIQYYDVVFADKKNNVITFKDSQETDHLVPVEVEYKYFDTGEIIVTYYRNKAMYQSEIYRFEYGVKGDYTFLYTGYRNKYQDENYGTGTREEEYRQTKEEYDNILKMSLPYMKYPPANFESEQTMDVTMYSEKYLLLEKYHEMDLSKFDSHILNGFVLEDTFLITNYKDIKIYVGLSDSERKVKKAIEKLEDILENKTYITWLENQIAGIYKLYKEWYDEDEYSVPFIKDIDEYKEQYYLESLSIDEKNNIMASYNDKSDSFLGHGVHIDVSSRGKVSKFSL